MRRLFSTRHERRHKDQIHQYVNTIDAAIVMHERDYISLEGLYHVTLQVRPRRHPPNGQEKNLVLTPGSSSFPLPLSAFLLKSCMDLLRLLRRGVYQHKTWRKEHGQALIDQYQASVDHANTILPNHMQLDDLPALSSVGIEQEIKAGASLKDLFYNSSSSRSLK